MRETYLYVDVDNCRNASGVSESGPTPDDLICVETGLLEVYRISQSGVSVVDAAGGWHRVPPAVIYTGEGQTRHDVFRPRTMP